MFTEKICYKEQKTYKLVTLYEITMKNIIEFSLGKCRFEQIIKHNEHPRISGKADP